MQFLTLWLKKIQAKLPFLNFASVQILTKVHFICTIKVWKTACKTIDISKKIKYDEIKHNPQIAVDKLLDEVERNIDYLSKFKSSSICAPAIKMLKENLVSSISQSNGFNIEDNYFEVSTITFAVAGCIDALIEPLPVFNKEELGRAIVSMLKSSKN